MTEPPERSKPRPRLSVVIMARDEAINIADCLKSVEFADERIVADTGSRDRTCELARKQGAKVFELSWEGFGPSKARALALAGGDWVLSLDADERIPPALAEEILAAIIESEAVGYEIPRRSFFLGREMRHGGWDCDRVLRLVKRGVFTVSGESVHEKILVPGASHRLHHPMDHHTNPTFSGYLAKVDYYSTLAAAKIAADRRRSTGLLPGLGHACAAFFRIYLLQQGFRDGVHGALLAFSTAYEKLLRYIKAGLIRNGRGDAVTRTRLYEIETPEAGRGTRAEE